MVCGRITKELELRTTPSGATVLAFSLATNYSYKDKSGSKVENTDFHNIVAWGKMAELINQYCGKGDELFIEGRITTRSWEGKDGKKNYRTEIIASGMQFGQKKKGSENRPAKREESQQSAPVNDLEDPNNIGADDVGDIPF
jgi:single-strand DNA-binding protein